MLKNISRTISSGGSVLAAVTVATADFDGRSFGDIPRDALPSIPVESLHGAVEAFAVFVADAQAERIALF